MNSISVAKMKSNRKMLLILFFAFLLPAVISFGMYFTQWRPSSTVNHGELILPARNIEDRSMQTLDDNKVKFSDLNGKWTMVYFDSSECSEACISQLYFMRQIHASLGKNYDKMQRLLVLTDTKNLVELKTKLPEYKDMLVWKSDSSAISKLQQDFGVDTKIPSTEKYIYLVDQLGNQMMQYKMGSEPAGVRKDLERLLKYSGN